MLFAVPEGLRACRAEGSWWVWLGWTCWESLPEAPAGLDGGRWLEWDPSAALGGAFPAAAAASEVAGAALAPLCAWAGAFPSELENAGRALGRAGAEE